MGCSAAQLEVTDVSTAHCSVIEQSSQNRLDQGHAVVGAGGLLVAFDAGQLVGPIGHRDRHSIQSAESLGAPH